MMRYKLFVVFVASTCVCCASVLADSTEQNHENQDSSSFDASIESISTLEPHQAECKENEVTHPCVNSYCFKKYCFAEDTSSDCVFREKCYPGCICKEGYLRERNFTCVPVEQCYKPNFNITCGDNEIVSKCFNGGCDKLNCSQKGGPGYCLDLLPGFCEPGCVCKSNYLRAANGTCVPVEECPINEYCTKPHEYYNPCPPRCPSEQCSNYNIGDDPIRQTDCPPQLQPGDPNCYGECRCEEGFYRNHKQDCVPFEDCFILCSGKRETLVTYPESCETQLCDGVSTDDHQMSNSTCRNVCQCITGYVRNKHGECIAKENCDKCQGPNEHFSCSTGCDNVCSTLDKMNRTNCPNTEFGNFFIQCTDMCYCDDGFARDSNNNCIPVSDCPSSTEQGHENHETSSSDASIESITEPPLPDCKEYEVAHPCTNSYCLKKYCFDGDTSSDCVYREKCYPGCICKEGYLRERNLTCVPVEQCYKPNFNITCGENELFSKCSNGECGKSNCSQIGESDYCRDLLPGFCEPGCICKSPYLRAANGTCLPVEDCPKNEYCTKPHEYYDPCPPSCPSEQCSDYDTLGGEPIRQTDCPPQPQPGDPSCIGKCRCEEGFYKNYNGDCIPFEDCSISCKGMKEEIVAYPESCEPQLCDGVTITNNHQIVNTTCRSVCRCRSGNTRNKHGECIAKENCGKCQGPNEHFSCSTGCDNVCATLDKMNRTNCPDTKFKKMGYFWGPCTDMCYCDDGFARDSNNICIPVSDCPKSSSKDSSDD